MERDGFAAKSPPQPDASGFVNTHDGIRLYWESFGDADGPVMLLTDGIVCNGTFYWYMIKHFRERMRVVRWAYRGHGRSDTPADYGRLTMEDNISDLWSVMDQLEIGTAVHVGYSLGVQLLLDAAHRQAERFEALVLMAGAPGRPLDTFHGNTYMRSALPILYTLVLGNKRGFTKLWQALVPTNLIYLIATLTDLNGRLIDRSLLMPYFQHLADMDLELFLTMLASASEHDAMPYAATLEKPTLVVGGTDDTFTPFFLSEKMYEAIDGAELLRVEGGTHTLPIEQPDLVNLKIEDFLVKRDLI